MFQPTVIPLRQADLGRRFDQGLFVLVVVAAAVSTASSQMMAYSSHYVTDFHIPLFYKDKNPDDKHLVLISRIAIVVFTGIGLWWALSWGSMLSIFNFIFTVQVCGVLLPYIGMFFWPRMTTAGAKASSIGGAGLALVWKFILQPSVPACAAISPAIPSFITAVVLAIVVSLATKPEYAKVKEFAATYRLDKIEQWADAGLKK